MRFNQNNDVIDQQSVLKFLSLMKDPEEYSNRNFNIGESSFTDINKKSSSFFGKYFNYILLFILFIIILIVVIVFSVNCWNIRGCNKEPPKTEITDSCDGVCEGNTPVCDEVNNVCVECLTADHCSSNTDNTRCDVMNAKCVAP